MSLATRLTAVSVLLSGCALAAPPAPAGQPAMLIANDPACLSAISSAASRLTGHSVTLAPDAFLIRDRVVLTSVGQSADGRMTRPLQVLQLRLLQGKCELKLEDRDPVVAVADCRCRPAAVR